jgi:predicted CXXCH cytochrome family protein
MNEVDTTRESCMECHADLMENEEQHSPARKSCDKCHTPTKAEHPRESAIGFELVKQVPDLCYTCHDPKNEEDYVHNPARKGKCLKCHSIHSSPNLYLVKEDPVSKLCYECHELEHPEGNIIHQAVTDGKCQSCHNPHQADNDYFLVSSSSRLCTSCHKDIKKTMRLEHVHPPAKVDCLSCHRPHDAKEKNLIDKKPSDLCLYCHTDIHALVDESRGVHKPVQDEKACLNCHSSHASANDYVLLSKEKELCLSCHSRTIRSETGKTLNIGSLLKKSKHIHKPINEYGCAICHDPHASVESSLLTESFPSGNYGVAARENFELCFKCHNSSLIEEENYAGTQFRNGNQNLHYFHINGKKGRSCKTCHDMHASQQEHLISEKVYYGNWEMPVDYRMIETGGSCATGCHSEETYSRE